MNGERLKTIVRSIARALLGDYAPYFIYRLTIDDPCASVALPDGHRIRILTSEDLAVAVPELAQLEQYLGPESHAWGYFRDGCLLGACFYWFGDRYKHRGFWPLASSKAKLVQIVVSNEARGLGVARSLISLSALAMRERGFSSLYARIWHSNIPSLRAFRNAGWSRHAFVFVFNPLGTTKVARLQWRFTS